MTSQNGKRYTIRKWRLDGTWERINHKLQQWVRVLEDHEPNPSAAIVDSQSVESGTMISQAVGFDSGKLVKGRKRHFLVDTLGLVLMVVVTSAYESDQVKQAQKNYLPKPRTELAIASIGWC